MIEVGIWPIEQRIDMRELMYIYDVLTDEEGRQARKVMMECLREEWNNEWKESIKEIEEKYRVKIEGIENKKRGEWKKYVKDKSKDYIRRRGEVDKQKQKNMKYCKIDNYKRREYITKMKKMEATKIMQLKLGMNEVKKNYKGKYKEDAKRPLCDREEDDNEHMMKCDKVIDKWPNRKYISFEEYITVQIM